MQHLLWVATKVAISAVVGMEVGSWLASMIPTKIATPTASGVTPTTAAANPLWNTGLQAGVGVIAFAVLTVAIK